MVRHSLRIHLTPALLARTHRQVKYKILRSGGIPDIALLLWELWIRFNFKQLLRVTLAMCRDEEYPLESVDLP